MSSKDATRSALALPVGHCKSHNEHISFDSWIGAAGVGVDNFASMVRMWHDAKKATTKNRKLFDVIGLCEKSVLVVCPLKEDGKGVDKMR